MSSLLAASPLWYVARASGTVSLVLLTLSTLLGLLTWTRWTRPGWPRFLTTGLHRNVSLLAVCFVAVHVVTVVTDDYVSIGFLDAVVPLVSGYRPLWVGLGAVAFDLLVALLVTSLLRRRLGHRAWRAVHWLAYACFGVALVHAFGTGSDPQSLWFTTLAVACGASVVAAALVRIASARSGSPALRAGLVLTALAASAAVVVWTVGGPLRTGWAARAGRGGEPLASATSRSLPAAPFSLPFEGEYAAEAEGAGEARLDVEGLLEEGSARLHIAVVGETQGDGLLPDRIDVSYGTVSDPDLYTGEGRLEGGNEIVAQVSDGATAFELTIRLALDGDSGAASGTVQAGDPAVA